MPRAFAERNSNPAPSSGGRLADGARRFASPALKAALLRRGAELAGLGLGLSGLGLLVALVSYNPADPSFSTATTAAVTNLAGPPGALVSDLMLQGFGWGAMLPVGVMLGWAWRLATHKGLSPFLWRAVAVLVALPMLSAALHLAPLPPESPVLAGGGGALGAMVAGRMVGLASGLFGPVGSLVAHVTVVALAGSLSFAALGVPLLAWRQAGRAAGSAARGSVDLTTRLVRRSVETPEPPPYAAAWKEKEREEDGPGLGQRLAAPFRAMGGLFARRPEAPSPQLAAMLRAADAAAAEAAAAPLPGPG
ncbi:DNA translocase FtsK 4TM domain-containing protein, partial [Roseomonas sp. GC11]|uniref:DNA translocase FtsK 4TM domain-containing protein n=1 Tax=Roseomonas sp. GC11 TaxID=2950546 RepID=UPI00210B741B